LGETTWGTYFEELSEKVLERTVCTSRECTCTCQLLFMHGFPKAVTFFVQYLSLVSTSHSCYVFNHPKDHVIFSCNCFCTLCNPHGCVCACVIYLIFRLLSAVLLSFLLFFRVMTLFQCYGAMLP